MPNADDNKRIGLIADSIAQNISAFTEGNEELAVLSVAFHSNAEIWVFQKHLDTLINR